MDPHLAPISPARNSGCRPGISLTGLRVMVIDDYREAREALAAILEQRSIQVILAESGVAAVNTISGLHVDDLPEVLICDIAMPVYDGYITLAKIRAWEAENDIRIPVPAIAFTAFFQHRDKLKAAAYGFQAYLTKPLIPERLYAALAEMIYLRRSHSR
ncbi:MAG TPA: response regulator [Rhodocyclaceae bacterium]|nr:response regulator [Rhodocyclaceae bacterium]